MVVNNLLEVLEKELDEKLDFEELSFEDKINYLLNIMRWGLDIDFFI